AASAGAFASQVRSRRVFMCDQVSRSGNHVVNRVLLRQLLAADMPVLAILATPSYVRYGVDSAALEKCQQRRRERRIKRNAVRPVALKPRGVRPVERQALPVDRSE